MASEGPSCGEHGPLAGEVVDLESWSERAPARLQGPNMGRTRLRHFQRHGMIVRREEYAPVCVPPVSALFVRGFWSRAPPPCVIRRVVVQVMASLKRKSA